MIHKPNPPSPNTYPNNTFCTLNNLPHPDPFPFPTQSSRTLLAQPPLHAPPNRLPHLPHLLLASIPPQHPLPIERILLTLLKLLPTQLHPLLLPQPGVLVRYLLQAPGLKGGVGGAEAALGVALGFRRGGRVGGSAEEGERVEGVGDAGGVESGEGGGIGVGAEGVQLGEVEASLGFLGCGFGVEAFRGRALRLFFFGEEGVAFGFFERGGGFFGG